MVLLFLSNLDYKRQYVYPVFIITFINTQKTPFENKSLHKSTESTAAAAAGPITLLLSYDILSANHKLGIDLLSVSCYLKHS